MSYFPVLTSGLIHKINMCWCIDISHDVKAARSLPTCEETDMIAVKFNTYNTPISALYTYIYTLADQIAVFHFHQQVHFYSVYTFTLFHLQIYISSALSAVYSYCFLHS